MSGVGQTAEVTAVSIITGGTERFADATGTLRSTFSSVVVSVVGTVGTSSQAFTVDGTVSY